MTKKIKDKFNLDKLDALMDSETVPTKTDSVTNRLNRISRPAPAMGVLNKTDSPSTHLGSALERAKEAERKLLEFQSDLENKIKNSTGTTLTLKMPRSLKEVEFKYEEIDTELISVSFANERDQEFLDKISLADILPSFRISGQNTPGLVRKTKKGYELIVGSRRLACAKLCNSKYKAYVGDVPEADIYELSFTENTYKKTGPYERGCTIKRLIEAGVFSSWNEAASVRNIPQSTISRLKLCSELDPIFLKCFASLTDIPVTFPETMDKLLQGNEKKIKEKALELHLLRNSNPEMATAKNIISAFRSAISTPKEVTKALIYNNTSTQKLVKFFGNQEKRKIELVGVSDNELTNIIDHLSKLLELSPSN